MQNTNSVSFGHLYKAVESPRTAQQLNHYIGLIREQLPLKQLTQKLNKLDYDVMVYAAEACGFKNNRIGIEIVSKTKEKGERFFPILRFNDDSLASKAFSIIPGKKIDEDLIKFVKKINEFVNTLN